MIGRTLYEIYREAAQRENGVDLPPWISLGAATRAVWDDTAEAFAEFLDPVEAA